MGYTPWNTHLRHITFLSNSYIARNFSAHPDHHDIFSLLGCFINIDVEIIIFV